MPSVSSVQQKLAKLGLACVVLAVVIGRPKPAGVVVGVGLVAASLWLYALLFSALLTRARPRLALGLLFVKLAAFLALSWWVLSLDAAAIDPLGVAAGITCLPLAAVWEALEVRRK